MRPTACSEVRDLNYRWHFVRILLTHLTIAPPTVSSAWSRRDLAALLRALDDGDRRLAVVRLELEGSRRSGGVSGDGGGSEDTFAVDVQEARAATLRLGESTRAIETLVNLLPLLDACVVLSGPEQWLAQLCAGAAVPTIAVNGAQPPSVTVLAEALAVGALHALAAPLGVAAAARARAAAEAALVALLDASCAA